LPVPADNTVDAADALRFVATVDTGTSVSVTATNATIVSALHTSAAPVTAASGSTSLTIATGTGTTATFYVYTKTTAIGSVVINNGGTTLTYYVQGTAGKINNLTVAAPASGAAGTKQDILVTATDVFGNKVSGKSITAVVANGTLDTTTALTGSALTDFGTRDFKVTLPTTGSAAVIFSVTTASDLATAVAGFNTVTSSIAKNIAVRDLAAELATMTAAKAASDAALAAAVAKAASDSATAKALADAAAATAAADLVKANAEIAKLKADAVVAKAASDKALADATAAHAAELAKVKAENDTALKTVKDAFNKLARQWNKANPKAKVALVK